MQGLKPYKGEIHNWEKVNSYPGKGHLGFVIRGKPIGHSEFKDFIRTSLVVKYEEIPRHTKEPRKIEIETLNSRYHLIGEGKGL